MNQTLSFNSGTRFDAIDSAKAIAIMAIITGHSMNANTIPFLPNVVNSFHVPAFFIIAGLFIHNAPFRQAAPKYAQRYVWPYFVTCILIFCRELILTFLKGEGGFADRLSEVGLKTLWGSGWQFNNLLFGDFPYIGAIWFLLALFWSELFFSSSLARFGLFKTAVLSAVVYCTGVVAVRYIFLPWSILPAMAAVLLLLVGHLIRKYDLLSRAYSLNGWIWTLLIAVCVANILLNERISMVGAFMGFNAVGLFCCVVETVGIICFCHRFHLSFKWIGQNTLYILSAHLISMPIVGIIIVRTFTHLSISSPYAFFFASLTLNITLALALAWLMKRFNLLRFPRSGK